MILGMAVKRFTLLIFTAFVYLMVIFSAGCRDKSIDENPKLTTLIEARSGSLIAFSGGTITTYNDELVTSRGVCWSNTTIPTVNDNKTIDGSGPGYFESTLQGLTPNTNYFLRMYAIINGKKHYGNVVLFKTTDVVTDIDGNRYNTVTIGKQVWTVENLKTTRYQNGDLIQTTIPATLDIKYEANPKYQWACDGDARKVKQYGRLYTWYVVVDPRKICPVGWHIPSDEEWTTLVIYLIENRYNYDELTQFNNIAISLASPLEWGYSNQKGAPGNSDFAKIANKTGFTALPGGYRDSDGKFQQFGHSGSWWSSSEETYYKAYYRYIYFNISDLNRSSNIEFCGASIRCVKDY
jgi:uncharacterized protein (TIGR02145 family)